MSKPHSEPGDNGGRCEMCNRVGSEYLRQQTYPVLLGGYETGGRWGTLWLCDECRTVAEDRDSGLKPGTGIATAEHRARWDAIKAVSLRARARG